VSFLCADSEDETDIDVDNNMLPPEIEKVLEQVQAHANYMPDWQMEVSLHFTWMLTRA
jgi:hypothetical protein